MTAPNQACTVIAFDPGGTTGWAILQTRKDVLLGATNHNDNLHEKLTHNEYGQIDCKNINSNEEAEKIIFRHQGLPSEAESRGVDVMLRLIDRYPTAAVVLEDFILEPDSATKGRELLSPVRIISAFNFAIDYCGFNNRGFVQNRSPVKTTCTDERLNYWGINPTGGHNNRHARDAIRHAYYFLRNCRGNNLKAAELRWRAWPQLFSDPVPEATKSKKSKPKGRRIESLG